MPFAAGSSTKLRDALKRIRILVIVWRLLRKSPMLLPYAFQRILGWSVFPILGSRAPLRGYHRSTREYLKRRDGQVFALYGLRAEHEAESGNSSIPDGFVAVIPGGRAIGRSGAVVAPDHRLLADVSWQETVLEESQPMVHSAMRRMYLPNVQQISGSVAVLSSAQPGNYYHWLFDILPRFGILARGGISADFYLVNAETAFQRESLELLKIPRAKVISPSTRTHVQADQLIVPSLPGPVFTATPQAQSCRFLRDVFRSEDLSHDKRRLLYISRRDAKERRVLNEAEVLKAIEPSGFEATVLEGMQFAEQIQLFSEARVILGPHGAGLSNAVFCEPGTMLIEFMPKGRVVDCFERLARFGGLDYTAISADDASSPGTSSATNDHVVDIAALRQLLDQKLPAGAHGD